MVAKQPNRKLWPIDKLRALMSLHELYAPQITSLDVESNDLAVLGKQIFQISGAGVWRKSSKEKSHLLCV